MADIVLDTHACLFALGPPERLGAKARRALKEIEIGRGTAWIPAAVVVEIILLRELGRSSIGVPELMSAMDQVPSLRFLPLDLQQLDEFSAHTSIRDPFDRLILSACRKVHAKLVTKDRFLQGCGLIQTLWS